MFYHNLIWKKFFCKQLAIFMIKPRALSERARVQQPVFIKFDIFVNSKKQVIDTIIVELDENKLFVQINHDRTSVNIAQN